MAGDVSPVAMFWGSQVYSITYLSAFTLLFLSLTNWNTHLGYFLRVSKSVVGLKQRARAWKHIRGANFWECLGVIVMDLDAIGDEFAANFWPKTAEKTKFVWTLRFSQTFYF